MHSMYAGGTDREVSLSFCIGLGKRILVDMCLTHALSLFGPAG